MIRYSVALTMALSVTSAQAGWFSKGVGKYGPYTGGHGYSYATAYHYGFAWSAADTWRIDPFAYPTGVAPYRPYGKPISKTVFPHPEVPYVSVPGPDGLPRLVKPPMMMVDPMPMEITPLAPSGAPALYPVPTAVPQLAPTGSSTVTNSASIKIEAPATAEVWVEKEKMNLVGGQSTFQTPALTPGKMQIISVRAKWIEAGREVEQFRVVGVRSGETAKVTFRNAQP